MSDNNGYHHYIERPRYFCSFGGALSTLEALPETIPILHAAAGCAGSIAWGQNGGSGLQVGGYCGGLAAPSSNVGEREVIFGGGDRLTEQIKSSIEIMEGRLFVVLTSCVTEIIGDDVQAVVADLAGQAGEKGVSLVFARTGGFKGNSYYGYDLVLSAIIRQYVAPPQKTRKKAVNVLGIVPYMDSFWRGNLEGVRRLLELLGLQVNTYFTEDDTLEGLTRSSEAALNIVVSDLYGLEAAETYKELYGIPSISVSLPVGPTASANLLRMTAAALDLDTDANIEAIIEEQNRRYFRQIEPLTDCYHDADLQRYAVIIADVNYAVGITRFLLDDLGWIPELVQFTEILSPEQQKGLVDKLDAGDLRPHIIFDTNASEAGRYLGARYPRREDLYAESLAPAFVIGSSLERELALSLGAPHLSVSFPVSNRAVINRGYTGYGGGLTLTEDILSAAVAGR
ncbi:MAG: hypothetical protein LBJ31_01880 [Treponema sp.]|jgi:nitrogenase molybdenum-iron protein beta chain|nr:hypothetical protein [Treponema sp.]